MMAGTPEPEVRTSGNEARGRPGQRGSGYALIEHALREAAAPQVELPGEMLLNMELSNLAFQERVLELASEPAYPLLERVRFVSIFGSNMDEFFMTRVAGFQHQLAMGRGKRTLDGLLPDEQLRLIRERAEELFARVYREILPELIAGFREADIELLDPGELRDGERKSLNAEYGFGLEDLVVPVPVDPDRAFPHVRNLRPTLAVRILQDGNEQLTLITLPDDAPHLVPLRGGRRFVPLEEVLRMNLPRLLGGAEVIGSHLFRVTRSGNLTLQPDLPGEVVEVMEENVALRPFAPVVRLEVEAGMPPELQRLLLNELGREARNRSSVLEREDLYRVEGMIDLKRLEALASLPLHAHRLPRRRLKTPIPRATPLFDRIRRSPVLVRFPRHAFHATVGRFIKEAATDPDVEEIFVTLYRTNRSARIVRLLRRAHRNGKRVIAFVEVKASFDERRNIEWGRSLETAGIRVLYGPPTLKVHAKVAVVRRREDERVATYSYVGTGNLNAATASAYTDLGLLTADERIGEELVDLFAVLSDADSAGEYRHLMVAPFNLRQRFLELVRREAEHARAGQGGQITVKLNGIADRQVIAELYRASRAGVKIDLIVRGICSLRPGVAGWSENIRVVSNAGRFLEHSRIFRFANGGSPEYFIGSADWRGRNLSRRVEVVIPIESARHRELLDEVLAGCLEDASAWELMPDGGYRRRTGERS